MYRYVVEDENHKTAVVCKNLPTAMQYVLNVAATSHPHYKDMQAAYESRNREETLWINLLPISVAVYLPPDGMPSIHITEDDPALYDVYADLMQWANKFIKTNAGWKPLRVRQLPYFRGMNHGKEEEQETE